MDKEGSSLHLNERNKLKESSKGINQEKGKRNRKDF